MKDHTHPVLRIFICLLVALALVFPQGCARTGPILSESVQENIQHIGVVVTEDLEESLQDSRRGWLSSMGKGAQRGSLAGSAGVLCLYGAFICIPVLAAAGAVGGSVYGLYQASSETLPTGIESILGNAITDAGLAESLSTDLVAYGKVQGYEMATAKMSLLSIEQKKTQESPALQESFDTILEIEGPVVNLLPTTFGVDPPRRVGLSVRVRVIQTADQNVLDDRIVLEELGDSHKLEEWTVDQAQHFREELPRASRRLSEKILIDYFMRHAFKERTYDFRAPGLGGLFAFWEYRVKGLRSPKIRERRNLTAEQAVQESRSPTLVKSLTPTLRWERFAGEQVTYDLRIWETKGSRTQVGEVMYEREGLTENVHTVETSLRPSTIYLWSVRARFVENKKGRVTEWSKYKTGFTVFGKVITLGFMAFLESALVGEDWGFYQIQTP